MEGETGFLADRDPAQFASRIVELLGDPERTDQVARQAADIVRHRWAWERSVNELAVLCFEAARLAT